MQDDANSIQVLVSPSFAVPLRYSQRQNDDPSLWPRHVGNSPYGTRFNNYAIISDPPGKDERSHEVMLRRRGCATIRSLAKVRDQATVSVTRVGYVE